MSEATTAMAKRSEIDMSYYNPMDPDFVREPWSVWNKLARDYDLCFHTDLQMWFANSHELCADLLKNPKFTPNWQKWEFWPQPDPAAEKGDFEHMMEHSLMALEPAAHLRMRKLTIPAFSRKVMEQIEVKVRDLIVSAFDAIGDVDEFDVYEKLAVFLPGRAIARMVGVPLEAEDLFHDGLATNLTIVTRINKPFEERMRAKAATQPGFDMLKKLIAERRARENPGDDFLGTLIKTESDGDKLSDWEIMSLITALITAGSDTAIDLYTYAVKELLQHPDQYQLLLQKPELMENAVHEILRHGAMGIFGIFRYALEDQQYAGQFIRKGQALQVNMSTAWNDPKKWPDPRKFDITRPLEGNIIFGNGPHFCIGTWLVRAQAKIAITEFARRFPNAELSDEIGYDFSNALARRINKLTVKTNIHK
ncbi:MAG TPA: cytochrome P450 [Spongiibacteraceae bacterium]